MRWERSTFPFSRGPTYLSRDMKAMDGGMAAEKYSGPWSGAVRITADGKARKAHDSGREGSKGTLGLPGSDIDSLLRPGLPSHQQGLWANAFDRDA